MFLKGLGRFVVEEVDFEWAGVGFTFLEIGSGYGDAFVGFGPGGS